MFARIKILNYISSLISCSSINESKLLLSQQGQARKTRGNKCYLLLLIKLTALHCLSLAIMFFYFSSQFDYSCVLSSVFYTINE